MRNQIPAHIAIFFLFLAPLQAISAPKQEIATLAGGCFWCVESDLEKIPGVLSVVSGYSGGTTKKPTYKQVSSGKTGHIESVRVTFDPEKISYQKLLESFWKIVDPTDQGGQFVDRGHQYSTAIFFHNQKQKKIALKSKKQLQESRRYKKPVITPIIPSSTFYPAEEYHQDYYKKNPIRYRFYRYRSGRDQFLKKVWQPSI